MRKRMEKHLSEESGVIGVLWDALEDTLAEDYAEFMSVSLSIFGFRFEISSKELGELLSAAGGDSNAAMKRVRRRR